MRYLTWSSTQCRNQFLPSLKPCTSLHFDSEPGWRAKSNQLCIHRLCDACRAADLFALGQAETSSIAVRSGVSHHSAHGRLLRAALHLTTRSALQPWHWVQHLFPSLSAYDLSLTANHVGATADSQACYSCTQVLMTGRHVYHTYIICLLLVCYIISIYIYCPYIVYLDKGPLSIQKPGDRAPVIRSAKGLQPPHRHSELGRCYAARSCLRQ